MSHEYATCECHECTQARWKSSFQGQISIALPRNITSDVVSGETGTLGTVDAKNETLPPMSGWVKVTDRLPECQRQVEVVWQYGEREDMIRRSFSWNSASGKWVGEYEEPWRIIMWRYPTPLPTPSTGSDAPHSEAIKTAPKDRVEQLESIVTELAGMNMSRLTENQDQLIYAFSNLIRRSRELTQKDKP